MDAYWTPGERLSRKERLLLWALPAIAFVILAVLRFRHFGDAQVDVGQELAVASQLAQGKILYADIAYYRGPLSPYANALLMRAFGASLQTIMAGNLAVAAAITYGIIWITQRATSLALGSLTACAFVMMFVFAQQGFINVFNFVTPFVHELPHGILLSLLCLIAAERSIDGRGLRWTYAAGTLFGLALLTRIEIGVALGAAILTWTAVATWQSHTPMMRTLARAGVFGGAAALPVGIAILVLSRSMELSRACVSAFASYAVVLGTPIASSPFYLYVAGLGTPALGVFWIGTGTFFLAFWILSFFLSCKRFAAQDPWGGWMLMIMGLCPVLYGTLTYLPPLVHGFPLPITTVIIGGYALWHIARYGRKEDRRLRITIAVAAFSFLLLGKIFLAPHIRFYGFAHAMPAYLLLMTVLLWWMPRATQRLLPPRPHLLLTALIAFTILCDIFAKATMDQRVSNTKVLSLGSGENTFFVSGRPRSIPYAAFLQAAPKLIPPGSSLAAIPEGAMMNVLLDLPLVTGFTNYLPTDFIIYGKDRIEQSLYTHRPDFILLTHKDTSEFGYPLFGKMPEYGGDVMNWIRREYEQIALFGEQPLTAPKSEGVALWRRKDL